MTAKEELGRRLSMGLTAKEELDPGFRWDDYKEELDPGFRRNDGKEELDPGFRWDDGKGRTGSRLSMG
jgi:hypothetical protein